MNPRIISYFRVFGIINCNDPSNYFRTFGITNHGDPSNALPKLLEDVRHNIQHYTQRLAQLHAETITYKIDPRTTKRLFIGSKNLIETITRNMPSEPLDTTPPERLPKIEGIMLRWDSLFESLERNCLEIHHAMDTVRIHFAVIASKICERWPECIQNLMLKYVVA